MSAEKIKIGPLEWTQWPTVPLPTTTQLAAWVKDPAKGAEFVVEFHRRREERIHAERIDPLREGWENPPMRVLRALIEGTYKPGVVGTSVAPRGWACTGANDVLVLGGNGSGKTHGCAKLSIETLREKPGREVRVWSQNETTSQRYQQPPLYLHLPVELKGIKKIGQNTKISYTTATGFSENVFTFPVTDRPEDPPCVCLLQTYKGYEQDPKSAEGGECDLVWWDEEAPAQLIDTLRFRVHKKGGTMIGSFTPVLGYTETVGQYLEGAVILETIPARTVKWEFGRQEWRWGDWLLPADQSLIPGCPPGHVPFVLQSGLGEHRRYVVMFPTPFNPFTNVSALVAGTTGRSREYMLERLWGWPTKRQQKAFPRFGEEHLVDTAEIPARAELTIRQFVDPHGDRNWFSLWIGVDREGRVYVLREWPDMAMGEWALPGPRVDGKPGPAQRDGSGRGFNEYKQLFYEIEGHRLDPERGLVPGPDVWTVAERYMDPRPAGTAILSQDGDQMTYIDHMLLPITRGAKQPIPGLEFLPAPGCAVQEGTQLINDQLTEGWDPRKPRDPLNCPKLLIDRSCENLIYALRTWTGADGEKGATKDPIDCLRGAVKLGLVWFEPGRPRTRGGGGY